MSDEFTEAEKQQIELFCDEPGCMNKNETGNHYCERCLNDVPILSRENRILKRRWDESRKGGA